MAVLGSLSDLPGRPAVGVAAVDAFRVAVDAARAAAGVGATAGVGAGEGVGAVAGGGGLAMLSGTGCDEGLLRTGGGASDSFFLVVAGAGACGVACDGAGSGSDAAAELDCVELSVDAVVVALVVAVENENEKV